MDLQFNASTPLKTLLFCWGPYGILAFYAAIENASLVSPKLRMVRKPLTFELSLPTPLMDKMDFLKQSEKRFADWSIISWEQFQI
jgi:hypothetical protein